MRKLILPSDMPHDRPNCGVVSVAVVSGVNYERARWTVGEARRLLNEDKHDFFKKQYPNRGWRGTTTLPQRLKALDMLGVKYIVYEKHRFPTLYGFATGVAKDGVPYMLSVRGHAFAFQKRRNEISGLIESIILDQHGVKSVFASRKLNKQLVSIVEITDVSGVRDESETWETIEW